MTADLSRARALALQAFRDARVRTAVFAYIFALYAFVQPYGFRHAYPTLADRLGFAQSFARNAGLRLLYGQPRDVATVNGYTAWRVGGTLAIAAAIFGLFAAVRAFRAEEDAGRAELVLAGVVGRRLLRVSRLAAIATGITVLWLAELTGFLAARLPVGPSAYLALATVSVIPVCVGIGSVAGELAPSRRIALELGGIAVAALFVLRGVADTVSGMGWLRWLTPLGWAEELRPFSGPRPLVLLLPLALTVLLHLAAARLSAGRDIGTGLLPARDEAEPRLWLLSSPTAQALRAIRGTLLAWIGCVAAFGYLLGIVSNSISTADVSKRMNEQIAKLGGGSITTPTGYLGFVFVIVGLVVSVFACTQVGAVRQEEADQQLETLLALPVARGRWLAGRLVLAAAAVAAVALTTGFFAWAGAASAGADISLPRVLEAGANALPAALLFLGIAALAYALVPRATGAVAYGVVAAAFLWQLVASLLSAPGWLVGVTPFAHVGAVPAEPFRALSAAIMIALGAAAAVTAIVAFRNRDLAGA